MFADRELPLVLAQHFARQTARQNSALRRKQLLLAILWREAGHAREMLQRRVEAVLGPGCFGKQPRLTLARDLQWVGRVCVDAGHPLRYRRARGRAGYYLEGRPALDEGLQKKIVAAVDEVSPEQAAIQARLTPAERVGQGAGLSDYLLAQAVRRRQAEQSHLNAAEARRQALAAYYALES